MRKSSGDLFLSQLPLIRKPFLRTLAACRLSARAQCLGDSTVRNHLRGGRRNIRAGQEEDHCRPISYQEREQIWRDALARETATRKPGCENGELGKAALAVLRSLLFDFTNMKTGVCFPRVRTLQERLQPLVQPRQYLPCPRSPRGRWRPYTRVQAHEERGEGGPGREPLCVRPDHRSRAEDGAEGEGAREGDGARSPAGAMAWSTIRVSICAAFLRRT